MSKAAHVVCVLGRAFPYGKIRPGFLSSVFLGIDNLGSTVRYIAWLCLARLKPAGEDVAVVYQGSEGFPVEFMAWSQKGTM